jgi:methionine biosynthesis protein MetW
MQVDDVYQAIWQRKKQGDGVIAAGSRSAIALSLITKGNNALDIGCGEGTLAAALASRFTHVVGVDISENAVAATIQRGIEAKQVNLDSEPLPFADGAFDAVTCLDVLEHVFDPRISVREIARVCIPGATLVITTPNMRYWRHWRSIISGRFPRTSPDEEAYDGGHLHYYTAANLRDLIAPWFEVAQVKGVPGGTRAGKSARLIRLLLPRRQAEEFASPGIALLARRKPTSTM